MLGIVRACPARDDATLADMAPPIRTVELDDDLVAALEGEQPSPEAAAREALVMELFRRGRLGAGKAAALLGLSRVAFARRTADLGIPYFLVDTKDWAAELATIDAWLQS